MIHPTSEALAGSSNWGEELSFLRGAIIASITFRCIGKVRVFNRSEWNWFKGVITFARFHCERP